MQKSPTLIALLMSLPALASAQGSRSIILRSSWQTVNIGDIGHTPGVLRLLEEYLPDVHVRLWPSTLTPEVEGLLVTRFPNVPLIRTEEEISKAMEECQFLLHGSGPSLVGRKELAKWDATTGKPFGIYGITWPGVYTNDPEKAVEANPLDVELLNKSSFAFFRDSISLNFAKEYGIKSKVMEFCPDGAFAVDLRNEQAAEDFLSKHGLEKGKFLCAIPKNRFTPYWEITSRNTAFDEKKDARNQEMREHDHKPIRDAIIALARETDMKVLICPEDETQVKLGKEILFDKLPDDVKPKVVWRDHYWLTDEAVSTYIRSAGVFGLEQHSPIMCIGNGIPAIVGRFYEQTSKGVMWDDIGLGDWLFDMDVEADVANYVPTVLSFASNPEAARKKAAKARKFVDKRQKETMAILKKNLY